MKTAYSIILISSMLMLTACSGGDTTSSNAAKPASSSNSSPAAAGNANLSKPGEAAATATPAEPQLIGTYESREVHDQGVVTVMSQLKTLWMFSADGTYQRQSTVKGKPYHADSGMFRVEQPDKLMLTIQVSGIKANRKVQNPPLFKMHKFSLARGGDELRLTSEKGSVGVFERIAKPKAQ